MAPVKSALIGFHNEEELSLYLELLDTDGFSVETASDSYEMARMAAEVRHGVYLMDVNLGKRMSPDPASSRRVYDAVKDRVEKGEAGFLALSGSIDAVINARKFGVPAELKGYDVFVWLDSLYK